MKPITVFQFFYVYGNDTDIIFNEESDFIETYFIQQIVGKNKPNVHKSKWLLGSTEFKS